MVESDPTHSRNDDTSDPSSNARSKFLRQLNATSSLHGLGRHQDSLRRHSTSSGNEDPCWPVWAAPLPFPPSAVPSPQSGPAAKCKTASPERAISCSDVQPLSGLPGLPHTPACSSRHCKLFRSGTFRNVASEINPGCSAASSALCYITRHPAWFW
jgi:hypothetical protein